MKPIRITKIITFLCLLLFLGSSRVAGRYLFGEAQTAVDILVILFVALSVIYLILSRRNVSASCDSNVDKRKIALLALERAKHHKQKLKNLMRRIFPR